MKSNLNLLKAAFISLHAFLFVLHSVPVIYAHSSLRSQSLQPISASAILAGRGRISNHKNNNNVHNTPSNQRQVSPGIESVLGVNEQQEGNYVEERFQPNHNENANLGNIKFLENETEENHVTSEQQQEQQQQQRQLQGQRQRQDEQSQQQEEQGQQQEEQEQQQSVIDQNPIIDGSATTSENNVQPPQAEQEEIDSNASTSQDQQQQNKTNENTNNENEVEARGGKSTVPLPILLLAAVLAAYMIRKRMVENSSMSTYQYNTLTRGVVGSSWNRGDSVTDVGDDDFDDDNFTYGASVTSNNNHNGNSKNGSSSFGYRSHVQEMVPLSTSNDDEWGWEDSNANRDMELGTSDKEEERENALAISLNTSLEKQTKPITATNIKSNEFKSEINTLNSSNNVTESMSQLQPQPASSILPRKDSWDEESAQWEEHETTSSLTTSQKISSTSSAQNTKPIGMVSTNATTTTSRTVTAAQSISTNTQDTIEDILKQNFAGSTITSLTKPNSNSTTKPKTRTLKKVEKEKEDIFASMGLSVLPKKTTSSSEKTAMGASSSFNKHSKANKQNHSNISSSLSAAVLTADDEHLDVDDNKWGDDSDLDDLLDD